MRSQLVGIAAAMLVAVTVAVYAPVRGFEFLNYDDPDNLAAAFEKRGDLDAAIVPYAEALRLAPTSERARQNLESARRRRAGGT